MRKQIGSIVSIIVVLIVCCPTNVFGSISTSGLVRYKDKPIKVFYSDNGTNKQTISQSIDKITTKIVIFRSDSFNWVLLWIQSQTDFKWLKCNNVKWFFNNKPIDWLVKPTYSNHYNIENVIGMIRLDKLKASHIMWKACGVHGVLSVEFMDILKKKIK